MTYSTMTLSPNLPLHSSIKAPMSIKALQDYIFSTKYARYIPEKKRRETFDESVDRVIAMHAEHYKGCPIEDDLEFCRDAMKDKLVLGSQRALQFGGTPIIRKNARIYNCTTSYCDRPRFFQECLWLLLCGCGTGFSVQKHHIDKLPDF
jgi:ribonucleoside-triphosphate reductase